MGKPLQPSSPTGTGTPLSVKNLRRQKYSILLGTEIPEGI
jgi:hypothetical protein